MKMAVLLLWERSRGRASPVWGYIEQLPSSIDTPVRWSEAELAELQYAPAINEVGCWHVLWFLVRCWHPCCWCVQPSCKHLAHLQALLCACASGTASNLLASRAPCLQIRQQQAAWRQQYDKFCAAVKQGKHR